MDQSHSAAVGLRASSARTLRQSKPPINKYDVYQHIMDYWSEQMQDDCYQIAADGWVAKTERIVERDNKGNEKDKDWTCDLIPKPYIVARYFADEQTAIDAMNTDLESFEAQLTELEEEHGSDEGALASVGNKTEAKAAWNEVMDDVRATIIPDEHAEYREVSAKLDEVETEQAALLLEPEIAALANNKGNVTQGNGKGRCLDNIFIERLRRSLKMNASTCTLGRPARRQGRALADGSPSTITSGPTPPMADSRPPWSTQNRSKPTSRGRE